MPTKKDFEKMQKDLEALTAIVEHLAPEINIEAELENLATKRDGSLIYVGDLVAGVQPDEGEADVTEDVEGDVVESEGSEEIPERPWKYVGRQRSAPAARARTLNNAPVDMLSMTHAQREKYLHDVMLPTDARRS